MNKKIRIAFQLKHKDDNVSEEIGNLTYSDYQWNKRRYLYHTNGSNEHVLFKDDITDDIKHTIEEIIIRGKDKEILHDPALVYLYQFDDNGNSFYSEDVNNKWKEWMKANNTKTKPHLLYTYTDGLEIGCTPFLHEKCVLTTVRFAGDTVDYDDIGKLTEALLNQFINIENNITFRVVKLYDACMKTAHDLHLIDVNQDAKLTALWDRLITSFGYINEILEWIPRTDFYQKRPQEYELDLSLMDSNYWYKYKLEDNSSKVPVLKTTIAKENTGYSTSFTSFQTSYSNSSAGGGESGYRNHSGNDDMLLVRVGSVLKVETSITSGNITSTGVDIRIINKVDPSKYITKSISWGPNDGASGTFIQRWELSQTDITQLGGTDKFVTFTMNEHIKRGTRGASMYSMVELTGWKKNISIFAETLHSKSGMLLDSFINMGNRTDSMKETVEPNLNLDLNTRYNNPGGQTTSVFETPMRGDIDHKINHTSGSVTVSNMVSSNQWNTAPTLKTDVLCYNMYDTLVKTLTAQYGKHVVGSGGIKESRNSLKWQGSPGAKYMDCEATYDLTGQTHLYLGVNSNVIIKYTRDHKKTHRTTNYQYVGNMISGNNSVWDDGSDNGTWIGYPADPGTPDVSSIEALKRSTIYHEMSIADIPYDGSYKKIYDKYLSSVYGSLVAEIHVKRSGMKVTVLARYNWWGGGSNKPGRDFYAFAWHHRVGVLTKPVSSNVAILTPDDSGKTFHYDFNLGGFFKTKVRHTISWGKYGSSNTDGVISYIDSNEIHTGNVTLRIPDKKYAPIISNPKTNDCTILLQGGHKYKVISQGLNMNFNQIGVISIQDDPVSFLYHNTKYYGNSLITTQDIVITGRNGRSYKLDTLGHPAKTERIASGVPDKTLSVQSRRNRRSINPLYKKPSAESGMGYISKIILQRQYILDEYSNKWITIHNDVEDISFRLGYVSNEEWTNLYNNDNKRVYGLIQDNVLYIMSYYIDVQRIIINHNTGNTMEFILRDYETNQIEMSYSLLPYKPEKGIPVVVDNKTYYLELSDEPVNSNDTESVVFRDANDKFIGYLK